MPARVPHPLQRLDGTRHSLTVSLAVLLLLAFRFVSARLPLLLCTAFLVLLLARRVRCLAAQVAATRRGDIEYPSLISILDSLMLPEIVCCAWGAWLLLARPALAAVRTDPARALPAALLASQLLFTALAVVQQYSLSFFFTTCVGRGYLLFAALPRAVAAARTLAVTPIWLAALAGVGAPRAARALYLIAKCALLIAWARAARGALPAELGTAHAARGLQCPVCLENVFFHIALPCSHCICLPCFCRWGALRNTCPVCRCAFASWLHQARFDGIFAASLIAF